MLLYFVIDSQCLYKINIIMEDYYNMIEIEKSLTADSRTAEYIINKEELIVERFLIVDYTKV